jgi:hypothetical protein
MARKLELTILTPETPPKLSKRDPDYYSKIGKISAERRKMTPEQFSDMARRSHLPTSKRKNV